MVRLKVPDDRAVAFHDLIRGDITYDSAQLDDLVLLKSDGFPTYHLANVVDDHLMGITHVLRGDEWIASTPKHILIYEACGWTPPVFAHMPVILAPDGGKLSKRRGAASVLDYQRAGFLPEALRNFLALLGWAPGDDREIMTLDEMVAAFTLERVQAKAAVFDETKLEWMNGVYLQGRSVESLLPDVRSLWEKKGLPPQALADEDYLKKVIGLFRERSKKVGDIAENSLYFFSDPQAYEERRQRNISRPRPCRFSTPSSPPWRRCGSSAARPLEELYRRLAEETGNLRRQADPPDAAGRQRRQLRPRPVRNAGAARPRDGPAPPGARARTYRRGRQAVTVMDGARHFTISPRGQHGR